MDCIQPPQPKQQNARRRTSEPARSIPDSIFQAVRAHEFFESVSEDVLEDVVLGLRIHCVGPGDEIIREGTIGASMFLLLSGTVRVTLDTSDTILAELTRGAFFGEIGALYEIPRTATIVAKTISSIAILTRTALIAALQNRPDVLKMIVRVAQQRYRQIKPQSIMPGHTADPHYLMTSLRAKFSPLQSHPDQHLAHLIRASQYCLEPAGAIIAFADNDTPPVVIMILSGSVIIRDPSCDVEQIVHAGEIARFEPNAHFMSYISATAECAHLVVPATVYSRAMEGKDISSPSIEEVTQLVSSISLVNSLAENFAGPSARRRHSVSAIFQHDQQIHTPAQRHPEPPPLVTIAEPARTPTDTSESVPQTESTISLLSMLISFGIQDAQPTKIMPRFNAQEIDLTSIQNRVTDQIVEEIVGAFGAGLLTLNLAGTNITDAALHAVAAHCPDLIRINIQDCIRLSTEGIEALLTRCSSSLVALKAANCPAFTDDCLAAMIGNAETPRLSMIEIDISYCRLVSTHGWSLLSRFYASLQRLTLHRSLSLNDDAIALAKDAPSFQRLEFLDLSDCAFLTSRALRNLLAKTPALQSLNLTFCTGLDDNIAKAFSGLTSPTLKSLDLSYCSRAITDRSLSALIAHLPNLESISIRGTRNVTAASFKTLDQLQHLVELNVSDCAKINHEQIAEASRTSKWRTLAHEKIVY